MATWAASVTLAATISSTAVPAQTSCRRRGDTYVVDDPGDQVFEFGLEGTDTIRTTLGAFALDSISGVENLTYIGTGNFTGTGNEFDNVITGNAGSRYARRRPRRRHPGRRCGRRTP